MSTKPVELQAQATALVQTQVSVLVLDSHNIEVDYSSLPGNQPNTYGNRVHIWQNQNQVPFTQKPLKSTVITSNTQAGSINFPNLDLTLNSYIVGYAVGPDLTTGQPQGNVCTTVFIPAKSDPGTSLPPIMAKLSVASIGSTSLSLKFDLPAGETPRSNNAWAAIWEGTTASYSVPSIFSPAQVTVDTSSGIVFFNGITLGRGATYTVALFTSGYSTNPANLSQTAMAATLTFSV